MQHDIKTYTDLFINNVPLIDVRAPIEFERGAFPTSVNLPIMDDQQREEVGTCYTQHGQNTAIEKGHDLVSGKIRETRIAAWLEFANRNPNGSLYCFRGGLRSKIAQQWMHESGIDFPIVKGGYKAIRSFLIAILEDAANQCIFKLVGGKTGSGKTQLINHLKHSVDLEGAAYHRGSSFGRHANPQNSQINFENIIAIEFLRLRHQEDPSIVLEDEARTIGKVGIPKTLFEKMRRSPLVVIEDPFEIRLERLIQEYVVDMHAEFVTTDAISHCFESFSNYLLDGINKIQKRLGPARYGGIREKMQQALALQSKTGDISMHYDWLTAVLENYYDPMYEDQLNKRKDSICFRGNHDACYEFLQQNIRAN